MYNLMRNVLQSSNLILCNIVHSDKILRLRLGLGNIWTYGLVRVWVMFRDR